MTPLAHLIALPVRAYRLVLSPWLGHLMVSRQETARPLLTPGEVMQLPATDELVLMSGCPPIRARAGLTDPRVTYWEPAKWVARVRDRKTGKNPVLFRINMDAGHAGASGRCSRLEEIAYTYSFALKVTGRSAGAD